MPPGARFYPAAHTVISRELRKSDEAGNRGARAAIRYGKGYLILMQEAVDKTVTKGP